MARWSSAEIDFLREKYSSSSWEFLLSQLPNRSKVAVVKRANLLGLTRDESVIIRPDQRPAWSSAEDKALIEAHSKGVSCADISAQFLPHRNVYSIYHRISFLGLSKTLTEWSTQEEGILRLWWGVLPPRSLKAFFFPHRTVSSVKGKAILLGLQSPVKVGS